jgi:Sulfatase
MFFDHIRPIPLPRALLTLLLGTAFLSLLFLPVQLANENRLALDPRPEIEVLLLVGLVAVFAALGRRVPTWLRWTAASLLTLGAGFHAIAAAVPSFLERELDLFWDLPHVPNLIGLFFAAKGAVKASLLLLAVTLGLMLLAAVIALVLRMMERALRGGHRPEAALIVVGLSLALLPIPWPVLGSLASARLSAELGHQLGMTWFSFRVLHGAPGPYGEALASPEPPAAGNLGKLQGHDVYLVFFESYGTTVLDEPQFAAEVKPALGEFEASLKDAGYYMVSNRIDSPTFGGGSWLAHGTMASGLKLDRFLYRLLLSSNRRTLPAYFTAAGYHSLDIMPGLKKPWPEAAYWGFDRLITAKDLAYDGPEFGWFDIPDQWTLKQALEQIDQKPHPPLFTQIVLVSSHTPFAPVPPYVEDWGDVGPYKSIAQDEWTKIYRDPDWWHLEAPYLQSVQYDLKALAGWMRQLKGQPLVIVLGDHQPPGFVSGSEAPHTVPIHVLSRDPDLVLPFTSLGYVAGAIPPSAGEFKGMESFLPDFLSLFASGHSVAQAPDAAEPLP